VKYVTLYHGTPIENKDNILKHGIKYRKPDVKRLIKEAVEQIRRKLGKNFKFDYTYVEDRLLEATRRGGIVYVSGNYDYAYSNALAGREWFDYLLRQAIYKQSTFKELDKKRREQARKCLKLQNKLEKLDKKRLQLLNEGKYREYEKVSQLENEIWLKYVRCNKVSSELNKRVQEYVDKIRRMFYNSKAVIFTIKMPFHVLKSLLADDYSKDLIEKVEQGIIDIKDIDELHLKEVPRRYIVSYKVVTKGMSQL